MVSENVHSFILCPFFIYEAIKRITVFFPFNIWFIAFSVNYILNSKLVLICSLQLFYVKIFDKFFLVKILLSKILPCYVDILARSPFSNMGTFSLINLLESIICVSFYMNRFLFSCSMICIVIFINYII